MDRHYVSALLQYVRSFAVQYRACMLLVVSVDDKLLSLSVNLLVLYLLGFVVITDCLFLYMALNCKL